MLLGVAVSEGVAVRLTCVGDAVSEAGVGVLLGVPDGVGVMVSGSLTTNGAYRASQFPSRMWMKEPSLHQIGPMVPISDMPLSGVVLGAVFGYQP